MKTNYLILFGLCLVLSGCGFDQFLRRTFPDLTGGSKKAAVLEFNVESIDWGTQSVDSQNNYVIEITNTGEEPATELAAGWTGATTGFSFRGGTFPGLGGTCEATLTGGSTCNIIVTFRPPSLATFNASMTIAASSAKGRDSKTITLTGKGSNVATLRASEDGTNAIVGPINFGTHPLNGTAVVKRIHLLYSGLLPAFGLAISGVTAPYSITANTCPSGTLSANCYIDLTFNPTPVGTHTFNISLVYNNGSYADKSDFSVTGVVSNTANPATLVFNPVTDPFAYDNVSVNRPVSAAFSLINPVGGYSITSPITLTENPVTPHFSATHNCPNPMLSGGPACTLTVVFQPTALGDHTLTLDIGITDGLGSRTITRTFTGTGVNAATLTVPTLNFGNTIVGVPNVRLATVNYYGGLTASAMTLTTVPADPFVFSGGGSYPGAGTCAAALSGAGTTCTIGFVFTPTVTGARNQTMTLSYEDGTGTTKTVNFLLTGTGVLGADLGFTPAAAAFGDTAINSKTDMTITVRNNGGSQATGLGVPAIAAPFGFANATTTGFGTYPGTGGTCAAALNANATCTLVVRYLPTAENADSSSLTLNYNAGPATLALSGSGKSWGRLVISSPAVAAVAVGSSTNTTVTLTNAGVASITSLAIAAPPATVQLSSTTCGTEILPNESCNAIYSVAPLRPGTFTHPFSVEYQDDPLSSVPKSASFALTGPATIPMQLALGYQHSCLLLSSGDVKCWGNNSQGQLGRGNTSPVGAAANDVRNMTPIVWGTNEKVRRIVAGGYFTCGILWDSNGVKCFGANDSGQLGIESSATSRGSAANQMGANLAFVNLGTGRSAVGMAAGYAHVCAVLDNQTLKCWGANAAGQLGYGTTASIGKTAGSISNLAAVDVNGAVGAVFAGYSNTCAAVTSGVTSGLKCWGDNLFGQLGRGDTQSRGDNAGEIGAALPFMSLPASFTSLALGGAFLSLAFNDGTVEQLGRNETTLGLLLGQNSSDEVGPASPTYPLTLPGYGIRGGQTFGSDNAVVPLPSGVQAQTVASGNSFTCSKFNDGKVRCWGHNEYGQLGQNSTVNRGTIPAEMGSALPITNLGAQSVAELSLGGEHACVILSDQKVRCWGRNQFGQLGLGNALDRGDSAGEMDTPVDTVYQ